MRIVIFANGLLPQPESARSIVNEGDYIIAADGGAHHLLKLGLMPDLVVGDLDSLGEEAFYTLGAANVEFKQYPKDKDETDLELALRVATKLRVRQIVVVGALGGRTDQSLAALALLSAPALAGLDVRLDDGIEEAYFCRERIEIRGRSGETVSLIPWHGPVSGVRTEGLRWPLSDETLYPEQTRGISNEMLGELATVRIADGLLLIIHRKNNL